MATTEPKTNRVVGKITGSNGRPAANLYVAIYDIDLRNWELLSHGITNREGAYELTWAHSQLSGRGKKTADIALKVSTAGKHTLLYQSSVDEVRFNASEREEINVTLKKPVPVERVEYDFLLGEVSFLADKIPVHKLQESNKHRDVTFLSKELEVPFEKIAHLVVAHKMGVLSGIEPPFFYALLRKNTLLKNASGQLMGTRLSIGVNDDEQALLYAAALVEPERIREDVKAAVAEMIVSVQIGDACDAFIEQLQRYREAATRYYQDEHPRKAVELVRRFIKEGKIQEMENLFLENKNDLNAFFDKITDRSFFDTDARAADAQTQVELGKLIGFGSEVMPEIVRKHDLKKPADIRKLARLNKANWVKEISALKKDVADKERINSYASFLVRRFEKEYPTTAFAAQLEREEKSLLRNQEKMVAFFNEHPDFDLANDSVERFLKTKRVARKEAEPITPELKKVQRVFKLIPNYTKTQALLRENIHSSQNIVALGKTRFINEIAPKSGLSEKEASEIYQKAEAKNTAAMLLAGQLQDIVGITDIASFNTDALSKKLEAVSEDFPNLKTLFKLTDTCACEHCRSVYSPAAYLVELLQWIGSRSVTDTTANPPVTSNLAKETLFSRRPDLWDIDLGCANATTPMKYIDLVCELLEEAVAPDPGIDYTGVLSDGVDPLKGAISSGLLAALTAARIPVTDKAVVYETETANGLSDALPHYVRDTKAVCKIETVGVNTYKIYRLRQTLASAEELDAAPEYVNGEAYKTLKKSAFAFTLPFDLDHTEASAYFERFGVKREVVMKAFQSAGNPAEEVIAAEKLGLTDAERTLIVTEEPTPSAQQDYWNVPTPGDAVAYMKQVDHFLDKTGSTYKELELLLKLKFIDKNGNLFIKHNDLTCDTAQKEIANLDIEALDRIHRFLRLQKKTGWKLETLDEVISQMPLGKNTLDDACLIKAAQLSEIAEKTKIKLDELIGFYGEIPHEILVENGPNPLYHQIFLNKAKNGFIDENLLPEKIDGSQLITNYLASIAPCLKLKQKDLEMLLPLLPNTTLSFANLSRLFAISKLMSKLKLKAEEFIILVNLSGTDVSNSPQQTLDFIETADAVKKSPLKLAELQFILNHEAENLANRVMGDEKITEVLEKLKKEYSAIATAYSSKFDPNLEASEQVETLTTVLSALPDVTEENVKTLVQFLDKKWVLVTDAKDFVDDTLPFLDTAAIKSALDALDGASGSSIMVRQKALVEAYMNAAASYQIQNAKKTALEQTVTSQFKTEEAIAVAVLTYAKLRKTAPGTDRVADVLGDNFTNTLTAANFPKAFEAIRLLHKLFPFVKALGLSATDLEWHLQHNGDAGWLELDTIPYNTGQTAVDLGEYLNFSALLNWAKELSPVPNPADAEQPVSFYTIATMLLPGSAATRDTFFTAFALLTGYETADLDAIDAALFSLFALATYREAANWERVTDCAGYLRKLNSDVAQIKDYIKPALTSTEAGTLRAALKARYDEDTWLRTLGEIMDVIRPQKRDALVAYLLAMNPGIKDTNGLYDYFLVDVEMEACMPSSRIVQAHNSIQLFVQRCLMGLEPKAIANTANDPNWNQWKWMKNYRVWEANRKVFLYPENWYDVTLADDKSYLLTELISELQQNELTEDTANEALIKYLEKLDNIAFLEVMATWYQVDTRVMHVFARTKGGDPSIYYYRRFEQERYWTPWEKVELDITGNHLLAFIRNNRLHLAWPIFSEEPEVKTEMEIPNSAPGTKVEGTAKRKLKIQLAISEYSNKKWQPKKVSQEGILTPSYFTSVANDLYTPKYSLSYLPQFDHIWLFSTNWNAGEEYHYLNGAFDVTGCKGYPELIFGGEAYFPDFYPDFRDAVLRAQRYMEIEPIQPDDLSVRNGISFFQYYTLLSKTPGRYRITYPHQFTSIDVIAFLIEFLFYLFFRNVLNERVQFKIPLGTLLPYFKEDSNHAYVIIPGFYKVEGSYKKNHTLSDGEKRTAFNVFTLLEAIGKWFKKMMLDFTANPPANQEEGIQRIIADTEFQDILAEMSYYEMFDPLLNLFIGNTNNAEFEEWVKNLKDKEGLVYGEQFKNLYHPLVCYLRTILNKEGISGLMKRETQLFKTGFNFENHYVPNPQIVPKAYMKNEDGTLSLSYPVEDLDFTSDGSYSSYNWDVFFRVPLHIATSLTKNQRFEEALTWFHYMFNPTGALSGNGVQKYWVTKPFYLNQDTDYINQRIDTLLYRLADPNTPEIKELVFAVEQWRNKPFMPDSIARFRPVAYQKALLMKYIDNLTEWGDYLFRQDTMESVAQATQLYILADKLLGPKPRIIPPAVKQPYETYSQLAQKLDTFGNALIELENILPDLSVLPEKGAELPAPPITLSTLYFCVPPNENMLAYWDKIADRLFKIRHCQNIDGVERSLALFAPPIDPGMLVKAAASGLDISSVLAGLNAPTPYYRFNILSQKATELAQEVRGLGNSLLQALEKKDAEAMTLLRNELELKVLNAVKDVKKLQINEAKEQIEILKRTKKVTEERKKYYAGIQKIISKEQLNLDKLGEANDYQFKSQIVRTVAGALRLVPEFHIGASGFGGSPKVVVQLGGSAMSTATNIGADVLNILGSIASYEASRASILAGYDRRYDDWKLQERLANLELKSIEKQIAAAEIRKEIAETDLKNHELQIENAKKSDEFMRSKFTNKELYNWMIGQISGVYFKSYQLAHDFAKKAERSYRFELGNDDSYISYGYWDSLKKGLQSADNLIHDIKRMETGYLDKNKREYELTKHVSLAQLDPLALVRLRATGVCDFEIPEALYDMDHPGHYFRRLKSVSMSLPCIAGPYTSVSAKMSLVSNRYRKNTNPSNLNDTGYPEDPGNDERFAYNIGAIQSIATSNAQNDSGVFELNFRDERYLPFEGTGAISSWRLELPTEIRQFNYETISDVIIHVKYTAREGGSGLKTLANGTLKDQLAAINQELNKTGLHVALNLKHEMPNEWHLLKKNGETTLTLDTSRLPYMAQSPAIALENVTFIAKVKDNPTTYTVKIDGADLDLSSIEDWGLCSNSTTDLELGTPFTLSLALPELNDLEELLIVMKYSF